jgi:ribose-phosphate pyrophosphokinase
MELLFWIDAFKRASADSVTIVMPYFSYAKGDKKDEPRVSIRARVCADAIEAAGATEVHVISVAGLFAEAIRRIHNRESISVLFED